MKLSYAMLQSNVKSRMSKVLSFWVQCVNKAAFDFKTVRLLTKGSGGSL